jgi:single-stranded DNA-binding protein
VRQDRWQGEDEKIRERIVVVAEHVEFHPDPNRSANQEEGESQELSDADMVFEEPPKQSKKRKK